MAKYDSMQKKQKVDLSPVRTFSTLNAALHAAERFDQRIYAEDLDASGKKCYHVAAPGKAMAIVSGGCVYELLRADTMRAGVALDVEFLGSSRDGDAARSERADEVLLALRSMVESHLEACYPSASTAWQDVDAERRPRIEAMYVSCSGGEVPAGSASPWAGTYKESYHVLFCLSATRPDAGEVGTAVRNDHDYGTLLGEYARIAAAEDASAFARGDARGSPLMFTWTDGSRRTVFDTSNVGSTRCWRMVTQRKFGSARILEPYAGASRQFCFDGWQDPGRHALCLGGRETTYSFLRVTPLSAMPPPATEASRAATAFYTSAPGALEACNALQLRLLHCGTRGAYRQLAFAYGGGALWVKRNTFLPRAQHFSGYLHRLARQRMPEAIHFGTMRNFPSIKPSTSPAVHMDVVFDVDMPAYGADVRAALGGACTCSGGVCTACWPVAEASAAIMAASLRELFGVTACDFWFSGRKGYHCLVAPGGGAQPGTEAATRANAACEVAEARAFYVSTLQEAVWSSAAACRAAYPSLYARLVRDVVLPWSAYIASRAPAGSAGVFHEAAGAGADTAEAARAYEFLAPRIDAAVSLSLEHMIKAPIAVHPVSGRRTVYFAPPSLPGETLCAVFPGDMPQ